MSKAPLQVTRYAQHRYNIIAPIDWDVAVNYGSAVMAIAGSDGELAEQELQWYLDEQELILVDAAEYNATIRQVDWKSVDLESTLRAISYDFPLNFRRAMLYQAIKMCRADQHYHDKERAMVHRAAQLLGIDASVVTSIECVANLEETTERLRLALFETDA